MLIGSSENESLDYRRSRSCILYANSVVYRFVVKIFRVCVHSGLTVFGSMLTYNPIRLGLI